MITMNELIITFMFGAFASTIIWMVIVLNKLGKLDHMHDMLHMATSSGWVESKYLDRAEKQICDLEKEIDDQAETIILLNKKCDAFETRALVAESEQLKDMPEYINCVVRKNVKETLESMNNGENKV